MYGILFHNRPEINELYIEDDKVHIGTSSAHYIRFITNNRLTRLVSAENIDDGVTTTCFDLKAVKDYFRIEVTDKFGKKHV